MNNNDKAHFVARKVQEFQRHSSRPHLCPLCSDEKAFSSDQRLFDHATTFHPSAIGTSRDDHAWKVYLADASNKAYVNRSPESCLPVRLGHQLAASFVLDPLVDSDHS